MAYNEFLTDRIRRVLSKHQDLIEEKKMMGGLCFMYKNKMACGVVGDELMFRVRSDHYQSTLDEPHCRVMDFTGKPMKEMLYAGGEGIEDDNALAKYVMLGIAHADWKAGENCPSIIEH